jgi:hypothetical protein
VLPSRTLCPVFWLRRHLGNDNLSSSGSVFSTLPRPFHPKRIYHCTYLVYFGFFSDINLPRMSFVRRFMTILFAPCSPPKDCVLCLAPRLWLLFPFSLSGEHDTLRDDFVGVHASSFALPTSPRSSVLRLDRNFSLAPTYLARAL